MSPGKDTLTTNHCQTLEAIIKQVKDEIVKSKQDKSEEGKKLLAEAEHYMKRIANVKMFVAKIPITDKKFTDTKAAVLKFQKDTKTELANLAKKADSKEPEVIDVALLKYTRPKFMHNATAAGTLPVWTFQFTDTATKKTGQVDIEMKSSMTKDEATAKKMMSDAAIVEVKKHYPKATVKINNSSLES
jgi:hypothetical protein